MSKTRLESTLPREAARALTAPLQREIRMEGCSGLQRVRIR